MVSRLSSLTIYGVRRMRRAPSNGGGPLRINTRPMLWAPCARPSINIGRHSDSDDFGPNLAPSGVALRNCPLPYQNSEKSAKNAQQMKFYTQYNPKPCLAERFTLPSETVPDESMTVQEIIARYVKYGTLPPQRASDAGGNEAFDPEFDPMDHNADEFMSKKHEPEKAPASEPEAPADTAPESPA